MAGLTSRDYVATVIAGVTKPEQLKQNVASGNVELSAEQLAEIDRICAD
jgi:aryl-alcohol dehydrogenase-like predicted oxidoreductase